MKQQAMTKRKQQAMETKQRIFEVASDLFRKEGVSGVSVADIVQAAGVSTGTFYLYYQSKDHIIAEIYANGDAYYDELPKLLTKRDPVKRIIQYFDLSSKHLQEDGVELIKQIYFNPKSFWTMDRPMVNHQILAEIITKAQEAGLLSKKHSAAEVAEFLFTLTSGIIFEWCMHGGAFDMNRRTVKYVTTALDAFK